MLRRPPLHLRLVAFALPVGVLAVTAAFASAASVRQLQVLPSLAEHSTPAASRWDSPDAKSEIARIALQAGADPGLLKGFALALEPDPTRPGLTMDLSPRTRALLRDWGESEQTLTTPRGRLEAIARALPELSRALGSDDAALVALVVGVAPSRRAVDRVEARGQPPTWERLARRLPRRLRREAARTVPAALSLARAFDLGWPNESFVHLSSGFGLRIHPVKRTRRVHEGVDIPMPRLTPVTATASGRVVKAGANRISGRFVTIDHGRGVVTRYLHNDRILVKRGQRVHRGEVVALSGNTGRSTGPHLHYEVELSGEPIDPRTLFRRGERVAAADLISGRAEQLLGQARLAPPEQRHGLLAALVRAWP